jgi:hypothetical protein
MMVASSCDAAETGSRDRLCVQLDGPAGTLIVTITEARYEAK